MINISNKEKLHQTFFFIMLVLASFGLIYSRAAISIAQFGLLANWLLEGDFKRKLTLLKANRVILLFSSIWVIHVIWLLNTQNFSFALHDLQIKVPILILPIIIGTSKPIFFTDFKRLIYIFSFFLFTKTIYSTAILLGFTGKEISDVREIAYKFSHIRFSILIDINIFALFGFIFIAQEQQNKTIAVITFIVATWMSFFVIFFLKSSTGIIIWFLLFSIFSYNILHQKSRKLKSILLSFYLIFVTFAITFLTISISKFTETEQIDKKSLPSTTINGNVYWHNLENKQRENGNYVDLYLCEKELKKEWNKKSAINYQGKCSDGNIIKYTLIRYLTSKGLHKDSAGFSKLSPTDIHNIEKGMANYIFHNKISLYPKLYTIFWQIESYKQGGNPSGHSVTQRIVYFETGFKILKRNLFFGVGTGDLQDEFNKMYKECKTPLAPNFWRRAHNQYLSFLIAFGLLGGGYILSIFLLLIIKALKHPNYYASLILISSFIAMLDEDSLENQIGVTFFALFLPLFLWGCSFKTKKDDK